MLVLRRNQLRDQKVRQPCLAEVVSQEEVLRLVSIQRPLQLVTKLALPQAENGVLKITLAHKGNRRSPIRPAEHRVRVQNGHILLKPRAQRGKRQRFRFSAQVVTRVFERSAWSPKGFLAGPEVFRKRRGRNSRNSNRAARHAAAAVDDLESESISQRIGFGFVELNDDVFLMLCRHVAAGINFGPIEYSYLVELGFGGQQVIFFKRLAGSQLGCFAIYKFLLGVIPPQGDDRRRMHPRTFVNFVDNLNSVRLLRNLTGTFAEACGE